MTVVKFACKIFVKPGRFMIKTMTPTRYKRRAGLRFGQLIRQLIDDGWKSREIAAAIGCDETLVSHWKRVRTEFLFMPSDGYPRHVTCKLTGAVRQAEPDEIDYKLLPASQGPIPIEAARDKRFDRQLVAQADQIVELQRQNTELANRLDALTQAFQALAAAMGGGQASGQ